MRLAPKVFEFIRPALIKLVINIRNVHFTCSRDKVYRNCYLKRPPTKRSHVDFILLDMATTMESRDADAFDFTTDAPQCAEYRSVQTY